MPILNFHTIATIWDFHTIATIGIFTLFYSRPPACDNTLLGQVFTEPLFRHTRSFFGIIYGMSSGSWGRSSQSPSSGTHSSSLASSMACPGTRRPSSASSMACLQAHAVLPRHRPWHVFRHTQSFLGMSSGTRSPSSASSRGFSDRPGMRTVDTANVQYHAQRVERLIGFPVHTLSTSEFLFLASVDRRAFSTVQLAPPHSKTKMQMKQSGGQNLRSVPAQPRGETPWLFVRCLFD